jgi:hypothetical protein
VIIRISTSREDEGIDSERRKKEKRKKNIERERK